MSTVLNVDLKAEQTTRVARKQFDLFSWEFARRHGTHLIGTTTCWFLLDVGKPPSFTFLAAVESFFSFAHRFTDCSIFAAFYSQNLFQKDVYTAVGWLPKANTMSAVQETSKISRVQSLVALSSTVPGYWVTVFFIDRIGRFKIQLQGFFFMTVFMLALTIPYEHWLHHNTTGFLVLYAFTFFFANFGPNSTTFIVPAELFPARFRSTCHGISAAAGKAGAIVGSFGFLYAAQSQDPSKVDPGYHKGIGIRNALFLLAGTNALGFACTWLVPETNQISLEDLSGENEDNALHDKDQAAR